MGALPKESAVLASNYITSDLAGLMKNNPDVPVHKNILVKDFAVLMQMAGEKKISSRGAKDILTEMFLSGGEPEKIATEKNLLQKSNESELLQIVQKIITDNPKVVEDYKAGKVASLQFLVGQGMKASKGSANPEVLKKILVEELGK